MTINPPFRRIGGPLMEAHVRRQAMVQRMAADLIRYDAAQNEQDAIRSLYGRGYAIADVMMLVDDARMLAFQEIVAKEMTKP